MGIDGNRRQQQQKEKALQLEGAARHKRRGSESFQGACGPQGLCESRQMVTVRFKIVAGSREKCRARITNGLRGGPPAWRPAAFLTRPKISEDRSEVQREGADDLTLRAEEVDTQKTCGKGCTIITEI